MAVFDSLETMDSRRKQMRRRTFVSVALAGAATWLGYRWWRERPQIVAQRPSRVFTPNRDFYTVSISNRYPQVDPATWRLIVRSPEREEALSLEDLRKMPSREVPWTLSCISNPIGGTAVGNALWRGVPLNSVLKISAGLPETEMRVVFRGLDGFHSSVPLEIAMQAESCLVYEMNGVPLPREHGFPLRVLLPGKYGMKQPRWLQEIEVTSNRSRGYWESRGWSEDASLHMASRFDSAKPGEGAYWVVQGVAYCGATPVGRVEVSVDDLPWTIAELTSEVHPNSWVTWQWSWKPEPGDHVLATRVVDLRRKAQIEDFSGAFPSGCTGIHRVRLSIPG